MPHLCSVFFNFSKKVNLFIMQGDEFFNQQFKAAPNSMKHNPSLPKYAGCEFFLDFADLDFQWDPCIKKEYLKRIEQSNEMSYKNFDSSCKGCIKDWYKMRRNAHIQLDWIRDAPRIPQSILSILFAFTNQGEGVLMFSPGYDFFPQMILRFKRKCVWSPMIRKDGRYQIDIQSVKNLLPQCRVLILNNPHNPTSQVFTREELAPLVELVKADSRERKILVWSDEILADLTYGQFTTALNLGIPYDRLFVADSISKSFNISSAQAGYIIIPDEELRREYTDCLVCLAIEETEPAMILLQVCYTKDIGLSWLERSRKYFRENHAYMKDFCDKNLPKLELNKPDCGFVALVDFKNYSKSSDEIKKIMSKCKIAAKVITDYYEPDRKIEATEVRMAIGIPRATLKKILQRLKQTLDEMYPQV